ncbi:PAS domain-containing protein [Pedobacter heparinus]|uniref:histidine kinase n=1 Tax=Pedobacter heparinus (strain ATCC 13125 / DSM 2366 / CIP 104194 / JCM 7457 / NBRC 12017 / NCIMB 9290 / NRRL B-14731 / HIM 762-3) TaxID=485917 RepID=C6XZA6_PEDHD|nr:PAS domain-containing protein [Pedobacter heparinus]ACU02588.1 PAS sensor protein [Pedobacter heparinus DSM 2366]
MPTIDGLFDLESLEKKVLELNSKSDVLLTRVLSHYVQGIELLFPEMHCTIMQVKNGRLYSWVASSLPKDYAEEIEGGQIADNVGSCGTAAFLKQTVIVADIGKDPRWEGYREIALASNLLACWSRPIVNSVGEVMATFAIYYNEVKVPTEDELNIIERASSLLQIILESRQYAEALKSSNELYDYVNKATNDAIYDWDIITNNLEWGGAFFRIFGYLPDGEKFPIQRWIEMIHQSDIDPVTKSLREALREVTTTHWTAQYRFKRGDGSYAFIEENGYILRNNDGEAIRMIGVLRDITQRTQHELEIKEHLERYNAVSKATSDAIWDYDLLSQKVIWNNGVKEIFGYEQVEEVYQWWYDHVHPDDVLEITALVDACKSEKRSRWTAEYRFKCSDGNYKFVLDRGFLLFDDNGEAVRMIGAMQDITERINYIHTIETQNHRLRDIAWAQTHLVRAPLARIMGLVQLLREPGGYVTDEDQLLSYLHDSATELDKVIKGIIERSV